MKKSHYSNFSMSKFPTLGSHRESSIDKDPLAYAIFITNNLSIFGCVFNLILTYAMRNYREPLIKMVMGICVMDLVYSSMNTLLFVYHVGDSDFICQSMVFLNAFGCLGSFMWTCCFAHSLYKCLVSDSIKAIQELLPIYAIISTIIPFIYGTYAVYMELFGLKDGYCVYQARMSFSVIEFVISVVPPTAAVLYTTFIYILVIQKFSLYGRSTPLELLAYPGVLIVCLAPTECLIFYKWIVGESGSSLGLVAYLSLTLYLQGFLNALVYGFSHLNTKRASCCNKRKVNRKKRQKRNESAEMLIEEQPTVTFLLV